MGIGASIFLIAVGAILTFALDVRVGWLDLDAVGWIMMAAGVVGLILTTMIWGRRSRTVAVTREPDPYAAPRYEERTEVGPPRDLP